MTCDRVDRLALALVAKVGTRDEDDRSRLDERMEHILLAHLDVLGRRHVVELGQPWKILDGLVHLLALLDELGVVAALVRELLDRSLRAARHRRQRRLVRAHALMALIFVEQMVADRIPHFLGPLNALLRGIQKLEDRDGHRCSGAADQRLLQRWGDRRRRHGRGEREAAHCLPRSTRTERRFFEFCESWSRFSSGVRQVEDFFRSGQRVFKQASKGFSKGADASSSQKVILVQPSSATDRVRLIDATTEFSRLPRVRDISSMKQAVYLCSRLFIRYCVFQLTSLHRDS